MREMIPNTLSSFKNHLVKEGELIIDLLLPIHFSEGEETLQNFQLDESTIILFRQTAAQIDWIRQKATEILLYDKWVNDRLVKTEQSEFILLWYGIEEFNMILLEHGFTQIRRELNYRRKNDSQFQIMIFFVQK